MQYIPLLSLAILALVAILAVASLKRLVRRVTVFEHERGLLYSQGMYRRILEPGAYWYLVDRTTIHKLDLRARAVTIPGQEVLSADNVSLKVSLAAQYRIADPYGAINNSESYQEALYLELQLALREIVSGAKIDDLLERRREIGGQLLESTQQKAEALGLRLLSVGIKDMMFPGELKKIFAQVVNAQKEGLAALERARGETAALRSLANAAKMIETNPALLQLRLIQTLGEGAGNTVVLGLPAQSTPVPLTGKGAAQLPQEPPA